MGNCDKLGLKGRPSRPVGSLGTSKLYRVSGKTVLCYPLLFSASDFYLSHDMALLNDFLSALLDRYSDGDVVPVSQIVALLSRLAHILWVFL